MPQKRKNRFSDHLCTLYLRRRRSDWQAYRIPALAKDTVDSAYFRYEQTQQLLIAGTTVRRVSRSCTRKTFERKYVDQLDDGPSSYSVSGACKT
jgi:hypothetical protein